MDPYFFRISILLFASVVLFFIGSNHSWLFGTFLAIGFPTTILSLLFWRVRHNQKHPISHVTRCIACSDCDIASFGKLPPGRPLELRIECQCGAVHSISENGVELVKEPNNAHPQRELIFKRINGRLIPVK